MLDTPPSKEGVSTNGEETIHWRVVNHNVYGPYLSGMKYLPTQRPALPHGAHAHTHVQPLPKGTTPTKHSDALE